MSGDLGDMGKYNKLTQRLLSEGYTADNFPEDKVHIAHGCYAMNGDPLDNIYGGFEYNRIYCHAFVYKTGCGMHVIGKNVIRNMGFSREEWCHENDNPVIRCPYDKPDCPDNDPRLHGMHGGGLCIQCWCVCHRTDEPYDYEHSFEKAEDERQKEMNRKYQEFSDARHGRVCVKHMYFNERTREWRLRYDPGDCAKLCYSQDGYCPILGKQLSKKRGNVYYDLKTSGIHKQCEAQGSIFDGQKWTHIEKGIRMFDKPCSMTICEAFVKSNGKKRILDRYMSNHSYDFYMDKDLKVEILNVRAESKPSRDLMQDLQDIRDGIQISHASDAEKRKKDSKKEKRQISQQKRIEKLEKKILDVGYDNLEEYSIDRVHADKWLGEERIAELETIRQKRLKEEQNKPEQLSLFDFMESV